jgi:hypothetical protein
MTPWIPLLTALCGALVGGGIAIFVSTKQAARQRKLEQEKRLIDKFEQIHDLFSRCASYLSDFAMLSFELRSPSKESRQAALDSFREQGHDKYSLARLKMMVAFYAPTLIEEVEAMDAESGNYARLDTTGTVHETELLEAFSRLGNELDRLSQSAQSKLVTMMQSLTK